MNRFKCPACGGNQYTACSTAEEYIYCGHQKLKKMDKLMKHCGWIICPYNSEHDKDFDFAEPHCSQNKEHCELRDNPKEALKEILKGSEVKKEAES